MPSANRFATPAASRPADRAMIALAVALALLSCLPVLAAPLPQMSDYPAHLARYAVMIDGGRDAVLAGNYGFAWQWTGNLGVDLLIRPFAALFGLEAGGRIITGLIPPLTGLGLIAVTRALRRPVGAGTLLALAFVWSPMMLIGLLNYALGQAAALWAFALWVALDRDGKSPWWRAPLFIPIGIGVWLCHLSAWGVLGILVFGHGWSREKSWRPFLAPWPLLGPLVVMLASPSGTTGAFSYGPYWWIYKQAIWIKAMRDTSYQLDVLGEIAVAGAILAALAARRIDGRLGWAALAMLALSLVLPRHISGGDYADYRMVTTGLMIACLAIRTPASGWPARAGALAAAALVLARLAVTTATWATDSAETQRQLQALDSIPRGARVASAVLIPGGVWGLNRLEHIGAYAAVRRDALVNCMFAVPHVHMLRLNHPFYVDPSHRLMQPLSRPVDLAAFRPATDPVAAAQYLWYVGARAPAALPPGATIIWRAAPGDPLAGSLVARLAPPRS